MSSALFRKKSVAQAVAASKSESASLHEGGLALSKKLGLLDLTSFGIAAIVGAGIFSTIGSASFHGGPAIVFLFVLTAFSCGLSALSYAQFASLIPIAGSAYTYSYVAFGELVAWIIGWDLIMEYAIGNIAVAISWSEYFTALLSSFGLHIPEYFATDFLSAQRAFLAGSTESAAYQAYALAPKLFGIPVILDIPALAVVVFVTYLAYVGIKESKNWCNAMVAVKLVAVLTVICFGALYINSDNWTPFAPNGIRGVLAGVSSVFFAYIGFDAISTMAEECKNPQQDLPRSMIYSLVICTVLYSCIALVLTGMMPYHRLGVADPLSFVFSELNVPALSVFIAVSAVVAMASVLLVFQVGMPRIWMSMSRDGLLPSAFSKVHPKYFTPSFATIVTGFVVAIPALFMNLTEVTDLTSIGTLFAFALVNGGVLMMPEEAFKKAKFKMTFIDARYFLAPIAAFGVLALAIFEPNFLHDLVTFRAWREFSDVAACEKLLLYWVFFSSVLFLTLASFRKRLSLLPSLGLLSCIYLMSELSLANWIRFGIWLIAGLLIYFTYGIRRSKLAV